MNDGGVSSSRLEIRVLGPFDARIGPDPLPPLRTRKGQHLLALLALRSPYEVQREWIAASLWPESFAENAYYNLRRELSFLRSALGESRHRLSAPTRHSLRLDTDAEVFVDVHRFDTLAGLTDPQSLQEAVALYRGPLLEGWSEDWIGPERESRRQACQSALERLSSQAELRGDWGDAVRWLKQLNALDPLQDEAQRRLIDALAQKGDTAGAVLAYREYRERLRREMNAEPEEATTAAFRRIIARTARVRNAYKEAPAADGPEESVGSLPHPMTSFIGRMRELEELRALLTEARMVTILGSGGIGKTRLAIRTAEESAADFEDGVWFVPLADVATASLIPQAAAQTLRLREEAGCSIMDTLARALRSKQILLILDNCEHLVEGCGVLSAGLLGECPRLRILATSRQPIGIAEEIMWRAPSLSLPDPRRLPAAEEGLALMLPQFESSRLFIERATTAMPLFRLTEQNALAITRIVRRLEGIPLGIELAAARVRALTVQQVAARLEERFRLLSRGEPGTPARHQTLEAAIGWSYDLLSEPERALLRRLAIFTGGWTLEAAESVGSDIVANGEQAAEPILELLTDLIEKSLVTSEEDVAAIRRYRMLDSIREFALDRLRAAGEESAVRNRHASHFLAYAGERDPHFKGEPAPSTLDLLESDHGNFQAALNHYYPTEDSARLTKSLFWFWHLRGYWTLGRTWLERAEASYLAQDSLRAAILNGLGIVAWRQGDYSTARRALEEGTSLLRTLGERGATASALGNLGLVLTDLGAYAAATACHTEALEIDREIGSPNVAARLCNLGLVEMYESRLDAAVAHFDDAIRLFREQGHRRGLATALTNRGLVALKRGDLERADRDNSEAVVLCRELSLKGMLAFALHGLGMAAVSRNDDRTAFAHYLESIQIRVEIADQKGLTDSLSNAGDLLLRHGETKVAVRLWGAADHLREKIGSALSNFERSEDDSLLEARKALGDDGFEAAWIEGRGLSIEQAAADFCALAAQRK